MNASDKLKWLKEEFYKNHVATSKFANEQIRSCMLDPDTHQSDPLTYICANWCYQEKPHHQCYWNDRFVIAVMCNLSFEEKQAATWAIICNSHIRYFEWFTHYGYYMLDAFQYIGIAVPEECKNLRSRTEYTSLHHSIICDLVTVFNLPSEHYRYGEPLDANGVTLKNALNKLHPKLKMD